MIKNRDIIVFGDDWGRHPSTMQFIGKEFSKYNRVFWIGSIGMRKPKLSVQDLKRFSEKAKKIFKNNIGGTNYVTEINPLVIPYHDFKAVRLVNKYLIVRKLTSVIKQKNIRNFIFLTSTPLIYNVLGTLGERSSFYFCLDDYIYFSGITKFLKAAEEETLKKTNAAFYFSRKVYEERSAFPERYLFSQGVNPEIFSKDPTAKPEIIKNINKPIIGFWGLIDERFDFDLFFYCCKNLKDYYFLLIGTCTTDIRKEIPENVIITGAVPYEKLPDYAGYIDVGIIPYKINELTSAINPLKLIEYFAAGLPVVSTNLPEAAKFKDLVYISDTAEKFSKNIELALRENNKDFIERRKKKAGEYSWVNITESISEIIINSESKK